MAVQDDSKYPVLTTLINEVQDLKEIYVGALNGSIETKNATELLNARDGKATLREKIDEIDNNISENQSSINDIELNISELNSNKANKNSKILYITDFPRIAAETDDTERIKRAVSNLNNGGVLVFPTNDYYLSNIIEIPYDNIILECNFSTFHWTNTVNISSNYQGMFYVTRKDFGTQTSITKYDNDLVQDRDSYSYVTLNNEIELQKGDFVVVNISTGSWAADWSDIKPTLNVLTRVIAYDSATKIATLENRSAYTLSGAGFTGNIKKANPVKNVTIRNMNFIDEVTEAQTTSRDSWVAAVSCEYAYNINLDNINSSKCKYPSIWLRYVNTASARNIRAYFAGATGAGNGYCMQVIYSTMINIDNVSGEDVNPIVDCSGSSFVRIKNVNHADKIGSCLLLHGQSEHDIYYEHCNVSQFYFGSGIADFPAVYKNIFINNCNFDDFRAERGINITITNSKFVLPSANARYAAGLTIDNCDITIMWANITDFALAKDWRNQLDTTNLYFKLINSRIKLKRHSKYDQTMNLYFGYNHLFMIKNCIIEVEDFSNTTCVFRIRKCDNIKLTDNILINTSFYYSSLNNNAFVEVARNKFILTMLNYSILNFNNIESIVGNSCVFMIKDNVFDAPGVSVKPRAVRATTLDGVNQTIIFKDNIYQNNITDGNIVTGANITKQVLNNLIRTDLGSVTANT